jgi:tetratricopeptide (TPR) repeat protein
MAAKPKHAAPNYLLVLLLGLAGAAGGWSFATYVLKHGQQEVIICSVVGFLLFAAAGLVKSTATDARLMAEEKALKQSVESAYQAQSLGRIDEAEKLLVDAVNRSQRLPSGNLNSLAAVHSLANVYRVKQTVEPAEQKYREAMAMYERLGKTEDVNYAYCLRDCALVLEARGQVDESLKLSRQAVGVLEKHGSKRDIAQAMSLLARNTRASGNVAESVRMYENIKQMQIEQLGENSPEVVDTTITLARCLRTLDKLPEALEQYKDALVRLNRSERPHRAYEAETLVEMAEVRLAQGAHKDAEPLSIGALKILQSYVGPREKLLARLAACVKEAREKLGQPVAETEFLWLFLNNRDQVRDIFRDNVELAKQKDRTGWGALQWTLFLGWEDLMRWLGRNGAAWEGFDTSVMWPIHVAAAWSKGGTIGYLNEQGVTMDVVGPNGWSPVHYAAYHGRQDCLEQLLARGCDGTRLDQVGRSALHYAAEQGKNDIVTLLLAKGLDKNQADSKFGRSPLHLAASAGHGSVVRTLLMNGADETLPDQSGKTPINLAENAGHNGLVTAMKHFRSAMEK